MFNGLLTPAFTPFTIALGVMLLIAATETMAMLFGASISGLFDQAAPDVDAELDIDAPVSLGGDTPGALSQVLGWLCVGKVPVLVLLVAFLTAFGLTGLFLQTLVFSVAGFYLPVLIAVIVALFLSLPPTRLLALGLSRLVPKEESEAVSSQSFLGKVAIITRGIARKDVPAEAKLRDAFGKMHYVLVEPDQQDGSFEPGTEVLLTSQMSAIRFKAIRNENPLLSSS